MVAFFTRRNDGTGFRKSYKLKAQMEMAQSWKRVGENRYGMGRRRRLDESTNKEKYS